MEFFSKDARVFFGGLGRFCFGLFGREHAARLETLVSICRERKDTRRKRDLNMICIALAPPEERDNVDVRRRE